MSYLIKDIVKSRTFVGDWRPNWDILVDELQILGTIKEITVDNSSSMGSGASITWKSISGEKPKVNTKVEINMGYGEATNRVFKGWIDDIDKKNPPYSLSVFARDTQKKFLDQIVTNPNAEPEEDPHHIVFEDTTPEYIFSVLCSWVGLEQEEGYIYTEESHVTFEEFEIYWESYGDVISELSDITGFEFYTDEIGRCFFQYPNYRQPSRENEPITLAFGISELENKYIVDGSEYLRRYKLGEDPDLLQRDVDYEIDYRNGRITSIEEGDIEEGETLHISYIYAAHDFQENQDLKLINVKTQDEDLYTKVVVVGEFENENEEIEEIKAEAEFPQKEDYNLFEQKILRLDVGKNADTFNKCEEIANRQVSIMKSKAKKVRLQTLAVPSLKVGDCIFVKDTPTETEEIYRIKDISFSLSSSGFMSNITANFFGYSPVNELEPEEPEE